MFLFQMSTATKRRRRRRALNKMLDEYMNDNNSHIDNESASNHEIHSLSDFTDDELERRNIEYEDTPSGSTDDEIGEYLEEDQFLEDFTECAKNINITHNDLSKILRVINKYHFNFPLDARTLLHTSQKPILLRSVEPGKYHHFGLSKGLLHIVDTLRYICSLILMVCLYIKAPPFIFGPFCVWSTNFQSLFS